MVAEMIKIIVFLIIAIGYSIYYFVTSDKETVLSMLYAVSLSYIAAFIFYLLQIYLPEKKRHNTINKVIMSRINHIIIKIDELCKEVLILYIPNFNGEINKELFIKSKIKCNYDDRTTVLDLRDIVDFSRIEDRQYKTLRELALETIKSYEENTSFLYKTFPDYLGDNVIDILEKMNRSLFMQLVPFQLQVRAKCDFPDGSMYAGLCELNGELKFVIEKIKTKNTCKVY